MVIFLRKILFFLACFIAVPTLAQIVRPTETPEVVLKRILAYKNLPFNSMLAIPEIRYSSEAKLVDFQNDIEEQWGFRPDVITNAFVWRINRIYLLDEAQYYQKLSRCIEDSLAHELTHFIQYKYRGWDLNDESLEWDAIDTQTWYRETYCK